MAKDDIAQLCLGATTAGTEKYEAEVDYINIDNSFFPEHSNLAKNAI
ncbi:hypothetical protein [Xenorhabdus koppenhoeferi]|nr:hypothetical protein [Xenorhabdus koppenhoeferi]